MHDTYQDWDTDYISYPEEGIDPIENDEAVEELIEQRRLEFREEWFQYLEEDG